MTSADVRRLISERVHYDQRFLPVQKSLDLRRHQRRQITFEPVPFG